LDDDRDTLPRSFELLLVRRLSGVFDLSLDRRSLLLSLDRRSLLLDLSLDFLSVSLDLSFDRCSLLLDRSRLSGFAEELLFFELLLDRFSGFSELLLPRLSVTLELLLDRLSETVDLLLDRLSGFLEPLLTFLSGDLDLVRPLLIDVELTPWLVPTCSNKFWSSASNCDVNSSSFWSFFFFFFFLAFFSIFVGNDTMVFSERRGLEDDTGAEYTVCWERRGFAAADSTSEVSVCRVLWEA